MRCRSSSLMAWKIPCAPPCSTIHSAVSAALSRLTARPRSCGDPREVLPGQRRIELAARHHHVLGIAAAAFVADDGHRLRLDLRAHGRVLQAREDGLATALLRPRRQQGRADAGRRRRVRILIDRGVHAAGAGLVDELQRVDRAAPVFLADDLVVRHLCRQPALLADGDGLADTVEHPRGFVTHVRDVNPAQAAGDAGECRPPPRSG